MLLDTAELTIAELETGATLEPEALLKPGVTSELGTTLELGATLEMAATLELAVTPEPEFSRPKINSEALSAAATIRALGLFVTMPGNIDASTTNKLSVP